MMRLNSFWTWTSGTAIPPTPTPTPTPTPIPHQSGHIIWNKVAGEWSPVEREKDRLPEKLVEHLKSLANERSQSVVTASGVPSRKATPWSKAATSSKADVLKYMGLSSKKDADSTLRTESAKAMKLRRMIEEEDEFLIHFDGFI